MSASNGMNDRSRLAVIAAVLGRPAARVVGACTGLLAVAGGVLYGGLSAGAALAGVLGFLLTMVTLVHGGAADARLTEEDLAEQLESQVGRYWRAEAKTRGLANRDFVPLHLVAAGAAGPAWEAAPGAEGARPAAWSAEEYQQAILKIYRSMPDKRLIVVGERGSGKSVLSLMLTLAILSASEAGETQLPIPLPISIGSWRPASESFAWWFKRRMLRAYPVIGRAPKTTGNGPVWDAIFSCKRKCLPILDGLDEIPARERGEAVRQLSDYFSDGAPLVLLSRKAPDLQGDFRDTSRRQIEPVAPEEAARYFEYLEAAHGVPTGRMAATLRLGALGSLGVLLKRPFYLDLVRSVLKERQVTATDLIAAASAEGAPELEDFLISWNLRHRLLSVRSGGPRKASYLAYLAEQMEQHPTIALPWWRLVDWVPGSVLIAGVAIFAAVPSYLLALRMPIGLTRGLAIGVVSGIAFGMLRGRPIRWPDLKLTGVLLPVILAAEGWCLVGGRQAVADSIEITTATILAIGYRAVLFSPPFAQPATPRAGQAGQPLTPPPPTTRLKTVASGAKATCLWDTLAVLIAVGLATTAITSLVSGLMHFHDHDRNPVTIFIAVVFGVGIAAAAARLLIVSPDRMEPSTAVLRWDRRAGGLAGPYRAGLISAVVVGIGGGVGGGLRLGLNYGVMLTIVFGLIVGIPVGLAGGAIRWLSAPVAKTSAAAEEAKIRRSWLTASTLRTDRTVTVGALIGIAAAAAAGIEILTGPFHGVAEAIDRQSSFMIVPTDGILFGLTIGLIVACFNTAWPGYAFAHTWLVLSGRGPVRLTRFLDELHRAEILRREGSYLLFRHYEFQHYLSKHGQEFVMGSQPRPGKPPDPRSGSLAAQRRRGRD